MTMAMFADMADSGNEWNNGFDLSPPRTFANSPHGGRKTTGYAVTEDPVVLYDGPRRYIVETLTHQYDWFDLDLDDEVDHPEETWAVVDVKLTFIFNKVKKQVIILKDIKKVIEGKELLTPLDIQFSNREEVDIGPSPDWESYAHFWHQENETCYGPDWHMAPGLMREYINETTLSSPQPTDEVVSPCIPESFPWNWPAVEGSVRVYLNGVFLENGIDYTILDRGTKYDSRCDGLRVELHPEGRTLKTGDVVKIIFKVWKYTMNFEKEVGGDATPDDWEKMTGVPHLYDMVQVISEDKKNVLWKAYWPVLSDYTPDGWPQWWTPLIWVSRTDLAIEPGIPFTIGEWDFMLGKGYPVMFRGVEVVGLTDWHHSSDADMPDGANVVEWEVKYMLEEVFNPWDLEKVTHKPTKTWVEWTYDTTSYKTNHRPFAYWDDLNWGLYNDDMGNKVFSERVWDLTTGELLLRNHDYGVDVTPEGFGIITDLNPAHDYKIMYHTLPAISEMANYGFTWEYNETYTGPGQITILPGELVINPLWSDNLGAMHGFNASIGPITLDLNRTLSESSMKQIFQYDMDVKEYDFKIYKEDGDYMMPGWHLTKLDNDDDIFPPHEVEFENGTITLDIDLKWYNISSSNDLTVTWPMEGETLHVNKLKHDVMAEVVLGHVGGNLTVAVTLNVTVSYDEMLGGRYEHTVVGKEAASVDSIGAALITAAFKNKQIEIGIGSIDMEEEEIYNAAPYVMRRFGDGMALTDYHMDHAAGDHRAAVKDDWCHTWQISGANLITVGGPGANVLTYYVNDFANAIRGHDIGTAHISSPWQGRIAAATCWNKNTYSSFDDEDKGIAVISTYHDINGTTILSIWGHFGRDTYYASRFFHEELIEEFQTIPPCITDVILEIDYTDPKHPTFDIVEVLGTISEHKVWEEDWAARAFMVIQDEGGLNGLDWDYMYTYADAPEDTWIITKGGIHDP
jgi:hypothetical protein